MVRRPLTLVPVAAALLACENRSGAGASARSDEADHAPILRVANAASLAAPVRELLDTVAARQHVRFVQESAGSLELARRVTELGTVPDVMMLADPDVFDRLLVPDHVDSYTLFARNRVVVAFTPRSRHAADMSSGDWFRVLTRPGVTIGRADPSRAPVGYRTLLVLALAERHHRIPGLTESVLRNAPARAMRPTAADLVALLEAGEVDYIFEYESVARAARLEYVTLAPETDLGNPELATSYGSVTTTMPGAAPSRMATVRGAPIAFAVAVPRHARNAALGRAFVSLLLSPEGRRILERHHVMALDTPLVVRP